MWKDLALKRMDPVGTGRACVSVCGLSGRPQVVLGGGRRCRFCSCKFLRERLQLIGEKERGTLSGEAFNCLNSKRVLCHQGLLYCNDESYR